MYLQLLIKFTQESAVWKVGFIIPPPQDRYLVFCYKNLTAVGRDIVVSLSVTQPCQLYILLILEELSILKFMAEISLNPGSPDI